MWRIATFINGRVRVSRTDTDWGNDDGSTHVLTFTTSEEATRYLEDNREAFIGPFQRCYVMRADNGQMWEVK